MSWVRRVNRLPPQQEDNVLPISRTVPKDVSRNRKNVSRLSVCLQRVSGLGVG